MISLGVIGLLHALLLPGLAVILWAFKGRGYALWDRFLLASPLSIFINYASVTILTWFSFYTSTFLYVIFLIECAVIILYVMVQINKFDISSWKSSDSHQSSVVYSISTLVLLGGGFLWLVNIYWKTRGTVFDDWDSIVSWNRWAEAWFSQSPEGSSGYPPGLPILFSLVYKFSGTDEVQSVAKHVAMFFPFFGLFSIWRAVQLSSNRLFFAGVAGLLYVFLILRGRDYPEFVMSGYADPVIASLSAFCLYFLCLAKERLGKEKSLIGSVSEFFVFAFCISASALIKQNGAVMAAVLVCCVGLLYRHTFIENKTRYLFFAFLVGAASIHWYVYSYFHWNDFVRASSLLDGDIFERLRKALILTISTLSYPVSTMLFIAVLLSKWGRFLAGAYFFPLWLFWAIFVSYDFRSAYYILPVAALVIVAGIESFNFKSLLNRFFHALTSRAGLHLSFSIFLGSFLLLLLILPKYFTDDRLVKLNYDRRVSSYDPGFNAELNGLLYGSTLNQKLVSCFTPVMKLPELKNKFLGSDCSGKEHQMWITRPDAKYFLFMPGYALEVETVRRDASKTGLDFKERGLPGGYAIFEKI